jgi:hypothetical protein
VFAADVAARCASGDVVAVPHMQAELSGERVDGPLERLLARRRARLEARRS